MTLCAPFLLTPSARASSIEVGFAETSRIARSPSACGAKVRSRLRSEEHGVSFREEVAREARFREKRRGVRLNSRVPVAIEWEVEGTQIRAEAYTRVVGAYGCLLVLPHDLAVDQRVRLTNLASGQSSPAVVVWKGNEGADGWELGIELVDPEMDFWGLEL